MYQQVYTLEYKCQFPVGGEPAPRFFLASEPEFPRIFRGMGGHPSGLLRERWARQKTFPQSVTAEIALDRAFADFQAHSYIVIVQALASELFLQREEQFPR